jgi:Beta propeller domain
LATRLQIYDTSALATNGGKLKLLNETDINGSFRDGRVVGSNVHLVTVASFNTYTLLSDPLSRGQPDFIDLSNDEYVTAAIKLAEEKLIPTFVDQLVEEIFVNGKIDLVRVSLLQSQISNSTDTDRYMYGQGILNYLTQVVSFDLSDTLSNNFTLSLAGAFQSSYWGNIYATEEMLVVTADGYNWDLSLGGLSQSTYLLGFKFDGASSTPYAVGSIVGYLIGQFSVDIHDGYMRLATTVETILPYNESATSEYFQNQGMLTQNFITILEIPSVVNNTLGELKVVGRTESFGKDREVLTSVRFFDDIVYCATFEVIDQFYVVNLTDPLNPRSLGMLKNVTGFSSYLHPMNSANTLLLAVGQEANATTGMSSGLQLTVFDASNPIKPVTLQRYTVETEKFGSSKSEAEWDFKAFRYLSLGDDIGVVIIPVRIIGVSSTVANFNFLYGGLLVFDGFVVFDVNTSGITERIRIAHVMSGDTRGCISNAYLPARSFAYTGNIMTLKGRTVVSTNLDTGDQKWNLTLPSPDYPNECLYW